MPKKQKSEGTIKKLKGLDLGIYPASKTVSTVFIRKDLKDGREGSGILKRIGPEAGQQDLK